MVDVLEYVLNFQFYAGISGSTEIRTLSSGNKLWVKGRIIDSIDQLGTNVPGITEAKAILQKGISSRDDFFLGAIGPFNWRVSGGRRAGRRRR